MQKIQCTQKKAADSLHYYPLTGPKTALVSFIPFIQPSMWIDQKLLHLYTASICPSELLSMHFFPSADGYIDSTAQTSVYLAVWMVCATGLSRVADVALRALRVGEDDPVGSGVQTHLHGHAWQHLPSPSATSSSSFSAQQL